MKKDLKRLEKKQKKFLTKIDDMKKNKYVMTNFKKWLNRETKKQVILNLSKATLYQECLKKIERLEKEYDIKTNDLLDKK